MVFSSSDNPFCTKAARNAEHQNKQSRCGFLLLALVLGLFQSGIAIYVVWQLVRAGS